MDTWVIVLIIIAAIVLVGIIVVGGRRARERQLDSKRSEAANLRTEADRGTSQAAERASFAEEQAQQAEQERAKADETRRRADEIDPDRDTQPRSARRLSACRPAWRSSEPRSTSARVAEASTWARRRSVTRG
jgi:FtsZ-interacting cell division protein ZipA